MDVIIGLVIAGCAIAGALWGAIRLASIALALAAAVLAGRLLGPMMTPLVASLGDFHGQQRLLATVAAALVAAAVVLIAGRGLRKGLEALHLSCLDRIAGALVGGGGAALLLAIGLAVAAGAGKVPDTPWALGLAGAGKVLLALHKSPLSNVSPSNTPPTPTSRGQHPR
ncbi:MAG: CvpA family protein [Acidobacteriota bacterium]